MILLNNNQTNKIYTTLSDVVSGYTGNTFYFEFLNKQNLSVFSTGLTDISEIKERYNLFELNIQNWNEGTYEYYVFTDETKVNLLEKGMCLVKLSEDNKIFYESDDEIRVYE